jgi:DNA ligase-4
MAVPRTFSLISNFDMDSFDQVSRSIQENGGKLVALDDPKLTHIVLDKRDNSRRLMLMQRTFE